MQIITVMALVQLQGTSYYMKKKTLHYSVPVKHGKTFKIYSRTFKDFPGQEKKKVRLFRTFPGCCNPALLSTGATQYFFISQYSKWFSMQFACFLAV